MTKTRHTLGITTYREKASENAELEAFKLFKKNYKERASENIAKYVKRMLLKKFKRINIINCHPAIGVYEGGSEPSCIPVFNGESIDFKRGGYNYKLIELFKSFTMQDSILLYEIVERGKMGLKIKIPYSKLTKLQSALTKASKIGGFMTYDYTNKSITIINVKEFDDMTDEQFLHNVIKIMPIITKLGGTLTTFQVQYKIF